MKQVRIRYQGRDHACREGETVLDALLRQGASPAFSCRRGSCLACRMHRVDGAEPTAESQKGLRPRMRELGYFLPCKLEPQGDMEIEPRRADDELAIGTLVDKTHLAPDVVRLVLETNTPLSYRAGQFVNLRRDDGLTRSYSLASVASLDVGLELHVKRVPGGAMSEWLSDVFDVGDEVELDGPHGRCFYAQGSQDQDMILIANGTGAAPLLGILREALDRGHTGRIDLFHGSRRPEGLYLHETFLELARAHGNLGYVPCLSGDEVPAGYVRGRANAVAFARCPDLRGRRVYVAGLAAMVEEVETLALRAGAHRSMIHSDPYEARTPAGPGVVHTQGGLRSSKPPPGAVELPADFWSVLDEGRLLTTILTDFYTRVFDDAVLAPYFRGVTKDRLIGQVYAFMRDRLTGTREYFGMQPRSSHHWMVISDEIFEHREALMETVLREHGLPEPYIRQWRLLEESFRGDIVKDAPWKLVIDGMEMPLDGFGEETLTVDGVCDGCGQGVDAGETIRYHLRLGTVYCERCTGSGT